MRVRPVARRDRAEWLRMRTALWPESPDDHGPEIDAFLASPPRDAVVLVAEREPGRLGGFLEAGMRSHAEGCAASPVGYLEGWWVDPDLRRSGVGRGLATAAEAWARSRGLTEMASDATASNRSGQAAHRALGYEKVGRIVCFRKRL
ncbi:MAG: GNAT family N-acetyltransferase [Acidobacteriota bacterium]